MLLLFWSGSMRPHMMYRLNVVMEMTSVFSVTTENEYVVLNVKDLVLKG